MDEEEVGQRSGVSAKRRTAVPAVLENGHLACSETAVMM
jgi:hypothetical protein